MILEYAESHFEEDVALRASKVSTQWRQGMGYLTVFVLEERRFAEGGRSSFFDETEAPENNRDLIWDISRLDLFGSQIDPFLFLHRLNVCALAERHGPQISGLQVASEFALKHGRLHTYPPRADSKMVGDHVGCSRKGGGCNPSSGT